MTHLVCFAEGYADETGLKKFEREFHGKFAANMHLQVIGEIPDARYKENGKEVV